jgi:hypothetical protein
MQSSYKTQFEGIKNEDTMRDKMIDAKWKRSTQPQIIVPIDIFKWEELQQSIFIPSRVIIFSVDVGNFTCFGLY